MGGNVVLVRLPLGGAILARSSGMTWGVPETHTSDSAILILVAAWALGLLIFYAIIKSAVKNAIKEALREQGIINWMSNIYTAIGRPEGHTKK
jgi:hypothetical protein